MSLFDVKQSIENDMLANAKDVASLPLGRVGLYSASVQGDLYNQGLMSLSKLMGGEGDPRIAKQEALQVIRDKYPNPTTSKDFVEISNVLRQEGFDAEATNAMNIAKDMRTADIQEMNAKKVTGSNTDPNIALKRLQGIKASEFLAKESILPGYVDNLENKKKQLLEMKQQGWVSTDAYKNLQKDIDDEEGVLAAQTKSINDDVKVFGDRWNKVNIPQTDAALSRMEKLIDKYSGADGSGNLPGVNVAEQFAGNYLSSEKDAEVIQALAAIENALLKERSGAAVTESEYIRFLKEVQAGFRDDAAVIRFIQEYRTALEKEKSAISGAFRPEVRNKYWKQAGTYKTYDSPADVEDLAIGTFYFSPDGKLRQKKENK